MGRRRNPGPRARAPGDNNKTIQERTNTLLEEEEEEGTVAVLVDIPSPGT